MVAAGIGAGTLLFHSGAIVGMIGFATAGIVKGIVEKKRGAARSRRLNGEVEIEDLDIPSSKLKEAAMKVKKYFKSEEGLRDVSWGLTSTMITTTALSIVNSIKSAIDAKKNANVNSDPKPDTKGQDSKTAGNTNNIKYRWKNR